MASKDFRLRSGLHGIPTIKATKALATVIEAGDMVALDTGLIVKATASSTAIAYCPHGADATKTEVEITVGNSFTLIGNKDADANFAVTQKGTTCDLKGTTDLIIDNDTSSTNVLRIAIDKDAGTVGSKKNIAFKIEKPLY